MVINIIKENIHSIENLDALGALLEALAFKNEVNLRVLKQDFKLKHYVQDNIPENIYRCFAYQKDSEWVVPSVAYNKNKGIWVAWEQDLLLFYDEKNGITLTKLADHPWNSTVEYIQNA